MRSRFCSDPSYSPDLALTLICNECMHERSKSASTLIHKLQRFQNKADDLYLTTLAIGECRPIFFIVNKRQRWAVTHNLLAYLFSM